MQSLTILMLTNSFLPAETGSVIQLLGLSRQLIKQGHKVVIVTTQLDKSSPTIDELDGIIVFRVPVIRLPRLKVALNFSWLNLSFTPLNIIRINRIIEQFKPDILHIHNHMFDMAFHGILAGKRSHIPIVISILTIIKHPNPWFNAILQFLDKSLLKYLVVRQADAILCADRIIAGYTTRSFGKDPAEIIPYGTDPIPSPTVEKVRALRLKYNLGEGPIILSLGHLHENRNRKELVEILSILVTKFPGIKLLIVGDVGTKSTAILAKKFNVDNHIIFTGAVPHSHIPVYISLADVEMHWFNVSHPHRTPGPTGLEVMASGKVLVSDADPVAFGYGILRDGINIVLIDISKPEECARILIDILSDPLLRARIGEEALSTVVKNFSWETICLKTLNVYKNYI